MPRFKKYSYDQGKMIPIDFKSQIFPGTFEFALNHIIDNDLDLSIFSHRYKNEKEKRGQPLTVDSFDSNRSTSTLNCLSLSI